MQYKHNDKNEWKQGVCVMHYCAYLGSIDESSSFFFLNTYNIIMKNIYGKKRSIGQIIVVFVMPENYNALRETFIIFLVLLLKFFWPAFFFIMHLKTSFMYLDLSASNNTTIIISFNLFYSTSFSGIIFTISLEIILNKK